MEHTVIPDAPRTAQWDSETASKYDAAQQLLFEHPDVYELDLIPMPDGKISFNLRLKESVPWKDREAYQRWADHVLSHAS